MLTDGIGSRRAIGEAMAAFVVTDKGEAIGKFGRFPCQGIELLLLQLLRQRTQVQSILSLQLGQICQSFLCLVLLVMQLLLLLLEEQILIHLTS